jgi:hypothetical protein
MSCYPLTQWTVLRGARAEARPPNPRTAHPAHSAPRAQRTRTSYEFAVPLVSSAVMTHRSFLFLAVPLLAACGGPSPADPGLVRAWVDRANAVPRAEQFTAPVASRVAAYTAIALYEGYAADPQSGLRSMSSQLNGLWSVPVSEQTIDGATTGAQAAREVLDSLVAAYDETRRVTDSLADAQIARRRSDGVGRDRSERSVALGHSLARAILTWAAADGFSASRGRAWTAPRTVAQWSPPSTRAAPMPSNGSVVLAGGPTTTSAVEPHWGRLRPFALRNADECAPPRPPAYSEARGSDFWKMGRELADSLARLTPEKRTAATYWGPNALLAQAAWTRAGQHVVQARSLGAARAAEAWALTSIAIADAYVGAWREKYRSLLVRPPAYLQRVFNVSAPLSVETPVSPEYPSEHAVVAAAASAALVSLLGDSTGFVDSSSSAPRGYPGFTAAREEMSAAAMVSGLQFVPAVVNGRAQGQCIGARVVGRARTRW